MEINVSLLKTISETPGAPGFEKPIRNFIMSEVRSLVDSVNIDAMGNLTAFRKGTSDKRLMLAAHMDEIGFIVKHIDDQGFVRFIPLGGFDAKTLTAQRVIIHGRKDVIGVMGTKPIHLMSDEERNKSVKITDFFIDLGMKKEEVEKIVQVGDSITRERTLIEMGDCFNGKSLDNRISVFVLIEALRKLKDQVLPFDTYATFTVQEEVGLRGSTVAALAIQPHLGIAIDTTIAFDVPGSTPHEQVTKLGGGVAIKLMDSSVIADSRMIAYLKQAAQDENIMWQTELLPAGGTDTASLQKMVKGGAIAGAISIPTRHIHQVIETVHRSDVEAAINLTAAAIARADSFGWEW